MFSVAVAQRPGVELPVEHIHAVTPHFFATETLGKVPWHVVFVCLWVRAAGGAIGPVCALKIKKPKGVLMFNLFGCPVPVLETKNPKALLMFSFLGGAVCLLKIKELEACLGRPFTCQFNFINDFSGGRS